MEGRSAEAVESARKVASQHSHEMMHEPGFGFAHLLKAIPLLTMVRFGKWDQILNEPNRAKIFCLVERCGTSRAAMRCWLGAGQQRQL